MSIRAVDEKTAVYQQRGKLPSLEIAEPKLKPTPQLPRFLINPVDLQRTLYEMKMALQALVHLLDRGL